MKPSLVSAILLLLVTTTFAQTPSAYRPAYAVNKPVPTYTDQDLQDRLDKISSKIVPPQLTSVVKSYIATYTVKKRDNTERMLGKMNVYFPIFEKYMLENDVPIDLKYLSIVESALNPNAVSRSGAVGLWQFMPATGREYGLKNNSLVDERKDPHKSTQAALKYLKRLHRKFGDWSLALAAYNGGPGRVSRAIKRGRSKNYWRIRRYLPRETRNYVPAFIAATYIAHFYHSHDLTPLYPSLDMQLTATSKMYSRMSFQSISDITGIPMSVIKALNPSYKQLFFPSSQRGNYITLPQRGMSLLLNYLGRPDEKLNHMVAQSIAGPSSLDFNEDYEKVAHTIRVGESLESLGQLYRCSVEDIVKWNRLPAAKVRQGQELVIYRSKYVAATMSEVKLLPKKNIPLYPTSNARDLKELPLSESKIKMLAYKYGFSEINKNGKYYYYQIRRRESLADVADKFDDVDIDDLIKLNKIKSGQHLKPGTRLLIKKWK